MVLYFIRHAQSENNALYERTGSSEGRSDDPELTEIGRKQAERLADYLCKSHAHTYLNRGDDPKQAGFGITHIYTSLMVRAVSTAAAIGKRLGIPVLGWIDLHERGGVFIEDPETGERYGASGKNRAYFQTHYPDLVLPDGVSEEGWWNRPFEGEEERQLRAKRFIHELLARHGGSDDQVVVVSHGGFYNNFLTALLRLPAKNEFWFVMNNTGITRIDFCPEDVNLVYMNRTNHLPDHLLT
jgi:2,3-bisphosphoglycerate-dependent phosphoglycerate mutase